MDDLDKQFEDILNRTTFPTEKQTPAAQQRFIGQYSWSALLLNMIYYQAMGDTLFFWISIIASLSVFLLPVLAILPFWARARAYRSPKHHWQSFGQFEKAQKEWDRAGWYSTVLVVIAFYLLIHFLYPVFENGLHQVEGVTSSGQSYTQQLEQAKNGVQQELGQ